MPDVKSLYIGQNGFIFNRHSQAYYEIIVTMPHIIYTVYEKTKIDLIISVVLY